MVVSLKNLDYQYSVIQTWNPLSFVFSEVTLEVIEKNSIITGYSHCVKCGRPLSVDESVDRGMGNTCWTNVHSTYGRTVTALNTALNFYENRNIAENILVIVSFHAKKKNRNERPYTIKTMEARHLDYVWDLQAKGLISNVKVQLLLAN